MVSDRRLYLQFEHAVFMKEMVFPFALSADRDIKKCWVESKICTPASIDDADKICSVNMKQFRF